LSDSRSIPNSFRSVIISLFASMHLGLFASCLVDWVSWWFVWLSVSLCGCGLGLFASQSVFYVCVLWIFCWLTWGRVYRAGPSRAQISDPHIPEPPLIALVCCSLWRNPCRIRLGSISPVFTPVAPPSTAMQCTPVFNLTLCWSADVKQHDCKACG